MSDVVIFLIALVSFFLLEMLYFQIANRFHIIDKPNQRSSHTAITIRGGGIIFPLATIAGIFIFQPSLYVIAIAVFLIGTISFLDDVLTLNNKLRIGVHLLSVMLLLTQIFINQAKEVSVLNNPGSYTLILIAIILVIGIINAYNFMDGINGITVCYSLVTLLTIWYVQRTENVILLSVEVWILMTSSLLVFAFFNFRKKAKTFAGDVGSISIALLICYLIGLLIFYTNDWKWLLLLGVYGLDTVATITCRIIRRENILDAHRSHFYQYLANERKWSHLTISLGYGFTQGILNVVLIYSHSNFFIVGCFIVLILFYAGLRLKLEGKERLFSSYAPL
jgi:UDP-GlcNAc:undecaprenyl-phosphate GlcNAc-1-phosphate transferase